MSLKKYVLIFEYLDHLIDHKQTGTPDELAKKLNVSVRQVYNYINDLKELGKPVKFSHDSNSYFYYERLEII